MCVSLQDYWLPELDTHLGSNGNAAEPVKMVIANKLDMVSELTYVLVCTDTSIRLCFPHMGSNTVLVLELPDLHLEVITFRGHGTCMYTHPGVSARGVLAPGSRLRQGVWVVVC